MTFTVVSRTEPTAGNGKPQVISCVTPTIEMFRNGKSTKIRAADAVFVIIEPHSKFGASFPNVTNGRTFSA